MTDTAGRASNIPRPRAGRILVATARPACRAYNPKKLPPFEDENAGPDRSPTPEQIAERAAVLRSQWDAIRWGQEKRRQGVKPIDHLTSTQRDEHFIGSDRALIRQLLWTEDDPAADVIKAYHERRKAKKQL